MSPAAGHVTLRASTSLHAAIGMSVGNERHRVAIVGGARIPFARSMGAYAECSNQQMLTAALQALVDKYGLSDARLGDVAAGAVLKSPRDFNLTREAVLGTTLDPHTPAFDLQRACGTSLETAIVLGLKVAAGQVDCAIAAGVDTASDAPIGINENLRRILLRSARGRTLRERAGPWGRLRPWHWKPDFPSLVEPRTGLSMGQSTELMAREWRIPREDQDRLALESHRKAAAAYDAGFFDDLVFPFQGLRQDDNLRRDTTLEKLAGLKPAFPMEGSATLTAGNSTPMTDGAAALLLASESWARARNLPVQAFLTYGQVAAVDFVHGEGLLMAPTYAVSRMLQDARLSLQDFDFYEIHEAFAAQVLCTLKAWESADYCREKLGLDRPLGSIDRTRLNVTGSSLAVGHPFAATGARIVATLAKLLYQRGNGRGLISICTAGGMGVTAIVER
jgi:acetyl-CoA C-acetyltransferase